MYAAVWHVLAASLLLPGNSGTWPRTTLARSRLALFRTHLTFRISSARFDEKARTVSSRSLIKCIASYCRTIAIYLLVLRPMTLSLDSTLARHHLQGHSTHSGRFARCSHVSSPRVRVLSPSQVHIVRTVDFVAKATGMISLHGSSLAHWPLATGSLYHCTCAAQVVRCLIRPPRRTQH